MKRKVKYLRYLFFHKWYVFVVCCRMRIPWRGLVHDLSKFLSSEWVPYMNKFFPQEYVPGKAVKLFGLDEKFKIAWLKHQHRNPHHFQYWIQVRFIKGKDEGMELFDMPEAYIKEMVADWYGAARAQGNPAAGADLLWFASQQHYKDQMTGRTWERMIQILETYFPVEENKQDVGGDILDAPLEGISESKEHTESLTPRGSH